MAIPGIVEENATLETLAEGFVFTEGPVWLKDERALLFSDIPEDRIYRWSEADGLSVFREPSGLSNGNTLDREGRLLTCEHGNRRVSRTEADGTVVTLADRYQGKRLNSPNDIVVKSDGSIYFTDPPYGLGGRHGKPGEKELDYQGVFRLSADGETLTLLTFQFHRPNGLAFSPDESILYINDSRGGFIRAFGVEPDGALGGAWLFAELLGEEPGGPDGMKVDTQGNVYCTGPGGVWVFNAMAEKLGRIDTPIPPANLAWGDDDWCTLYMTARESLYRIRMLVPGIPVG